MNTFKIIGANKGEARQKLLDELALARLAAPQVERVMAAADGMLALVPDASAEQAVYLSATCKFTQLPESRGVVASANVTVSVSIAYKPAE